MSEMLLLSGLDLAMLAGYLVLCVVIGVATMRRVHNVEDYFIGGHRFGKFLMAFTNFGATVSADGPILVADQTFRHGFSGIWINLFWIILTPYSWMRSLWFRRLRYITDADFFHHRYESPALATLFSIFATIYFSVLISLGLTAMGDSIVGILSLHPSLQNIDDKTIYLAVLCISVGVVLVYGICGGLMAAVITDFLQSLFIIFISVILIPVAFVQCGGFSGIRASVPAHLWDFFGSAEASAYSWYSVAALALLALAGLPATPGNMLVNASRDERAAQVGVVAGLFIKRFCTVAWGIAGMLAIVLLSQSDVAKNQVYGVMVMRLLAPLGCGLVGLVIAGLLAALMSTASVMMVAAGATVTQNLYRSFVARGRSESHYVLVGRLCSALVLVAAAVVAYQMRDVLEQFKLTLTLQLVFGPVVWFGLFWRRANPKAAIITVVFSAAVLFLLPKLACLTPLAANPRFLAKTAATTVTYSHQIATQSDVARGLAGRVGEEFSFSQPGPSVPLFFTALETDLAGRPRGAGLLRLGIMLCWLAGVDVAGLSVAGVDTLDVLWSILLPFAIMYVAGKVTQPQAKKTLDAFFARLLTPVTCKPAQIDETELARNIEDFDNLQQRQLFPRSQWVIEKPDRFTTIGMLVVAAIALLFLFLTWSITVVFTA